MNFPEDHFSGSTGNAEHDMDGREHLIESSLPRLFSAFDLAVDQGLVDPVVILIDCEDTVGDPIARGWEGNDAVDAAIMSNVIDERTSRGDERPTTILVKTVSFSDGQRELPRWFPYLSETLTNEPAIDGFYAVVISFGGAGVFTVPMSARPGVSEPESSREKPGD